MIDGVNDTPDDARGSQRAAADFALPLARMPAGASMAMAIDLGALQSATAQVPTLTDDGGLDAALGGALARAVGAEFSIRPHPAMQIRRAPRLQREPEPNTGSTEVEN